jgi:hypothetical protein
MVQGNNLEAAGASPRSGLQNAAERPADEEQEKPVTAPSGDRRRSSLRPVDYVTSTVQNPEVMYVREYDRGRELRTTPIQGTEIVSMLSSLVGENQAVNKRKVCFVFDSSG